MSKTIEFQLYMRSTTLLILCVLLLLLENSSAQHHDLSFINFSSKNGLSSNTVNAILKDCHGYMWFATDDGVNRFDGVNFTVYRHNPTDSTSIGAGSVLSMQEDSLGNIWFGTTSTLSRYNRAKNAFINYDFATRGSGRSLCIDHLGKVWVGSYTGLHVLDPQTGNIVSYYAEPANPGRLNSNCIISLFEDSRNRMWLGTIAGLHLYIEKTNSFRRFLPDKSNPQSLPDNSIRTITEDNKGNIWLGTNDNGLSMLRSDGKSFSSYRHNSTDINSISHNRIYAIAADNHGKLWVGTEDGLNIFDPGTAIATHIVGDRRNRYSFNGKVVRSIFIDNNGIYWFGTGQSGVNKYDRNLAFFSLRESNSFDPQGLNFPTVTSFVEDPNGDIYIGTDGGGLNLYHLNNGTFDHLQLDKADKNKARAILAMERAGNEIWVATYQDGLYVLNMLSGTIKHYTQGTGPQHISSNDVFCIKKDSKGNVWIGTNGNGVNMYDPVTGIFYRFDPDKLPGGKMPSNGFIRAIEEDRQGNIWMASNGSGIAIYDPWNKTYRQLNSANSNLPLDFVLTLQADHNGDIWAGLAGGGLCQFNNSTNKFTVYSELDGLSNGVVYKIMEDDGGKLWLSTNKGISSFDQKKKKFKNYANYNGLQQSTFALGAGLKTSSGEMFFGGLDGFNFFNPRTLSANRNIPALVFTDLKISNRSVIPGEKSPIKENIAVAKEIRLNHRQNFSLDFIALNYTAPKESRYSYMLDGFDKDWNEVGTSKTAVYTNLDPGKYIFRLKARSDDGLWSTPESSIIIYVSPPWWRTTYACILYVLSFAFILWAMRYRGIQKLKNKFALEQERLQAKQLLEQERREAERKHEFDEVRIKFLTNLSHEFRTPISLIVGPTENLLQQENNERKLDQLSRIRRNAKRLLNLVNQLLDFRKLEESELKLNLTEGDMVAFVKEVCDSFKDVSDRKQINFTFASSVSHYYTSFDRDKLERILFNLLSNAFKFTPADGKVWLGMEEDPDSGIKIIIADTGIGMPRETREKIFDRFFQGDASNTVLNQGSGIGLSITREFVNLHGGSIQVESIHGKGSSFTIQLPCKPIQHIVDEAALAAMMVDGTKKPGAEQEPHFEKPTVLIIEDHEDFRNYLVENLNAHYRVVEASDGKQGWQKVLSAHPQVIVSDINMPEMDGIVLCRKIRSDKRTSHIPIILLTALTGDSNQLRGLNTGANDYLTKPFNFEILNARIGNLLNLNQNLKTTYSRQIKVDTPEVEATSDDEKLLIRITQYIEANIDNPDLSVEELGKHLYMSRGSLYNKIVTLTGETPVEFIRTIKLNKAIALLENTDMKISEIGYEVGFATPNYFARAFKAKFNLSPSEYVNLKRKPR